MNRFVDRQFEFLRRKSQMRNSFGSVYLLLVLSRDCNEAHIRVAPYPTLSSPSLSLFDMAHFQRCDIIKMQHK